MTRYFTSSSLSPQGFVEVTEAEMQLIEGDADTKPDAGKVYRLEISIDSVPEEVRDKVSRVVAMRIEKKGEYIETDISSQEFTQMIEEAL